MSHIWYAAAGLAPLPPLPFDIDRLGEYGLRDYQEAVVCKIVLRWLEGYRRILVRMPTGAGKTRTAAAVHGGAAVIGNASQFIVHRKELINQTSLTLDAVGVSHGRVQSGQPMGFDAMVILAGVQTLVNRLHLVRQPKIVIVDECHHATSATYAKILSHYGPDTLIIGLTATPERLDGRGLDEHFDIMVLGPSEKQLMAAGHLVDYEFYGPDVPDMEGVGATAGEYNQKGNLAVMDKPHIIGNIVEHYLELGRGMQGIGFAVSREHSRKIVDAFRASGVVAAHLDGDSHDDERDEIDAAYRAGQIDIMMNVDLFGEGYDVPNASYLIDAAPSKSLGRVMQRWGRPWRPAAGKTKMIVCDHAGNWTRHGLPDWEREWKLTGREKKARGSPTDAVGVRTCLICYRVSESGTEVCPGCGTEFPKQDRQIEERAGKLTKIEREALARKTAAMRKAEEKACKSEGELIALAQARGYQNPRAWAKMKVKFRNNWRQ